MSFLSKLPMGVELQRQGVLTVGTWCAAAYLSEVSVLLTLSASTMCIPSSGPTELLAKLQTRIDQTRQGALTVMTRSMAATRRTASGGILDGQQIVICLQHMSKCASTGAIEPTIIQIDVSLLKRAPFLQHSRDQALRPLRLDASLLELL